MKRSLPFIALSLVLASGLVLSAQDAGMVLRTSVTYNTEKATLPLTDDQRRQADELGRQAQQANRSGQYGDALRFLYQGLAVMRNVPWTPALEFASSLQGKLDHAIIQPGARVTVTLTPLYSTPRAAKIKLSASLVLVPVKKDGRAPKPLGAALGFLSVLHTRGQTPLHHPHVHCVVPAGSLSPDGTRSSSTKATPISLAIDVEPTWSSSSQEITRSTGSMSATA